MREDLFNAVVLVKMENGTPELFRKRAESFTALMTKVNEVVTEDPACKVIKTFISEDEVEFFNIHVEYMLDEIQLWNEYFDRQLEELDTDSLAYSSTKDGKQRLENQLMNEVLHKIRYREDKFKLTSKKVVEFVEYFNEDCIRGCEIEL